MSSSPFSEHLPKDEFCRIAREIVERLGEPRYGGLCYQDDIVTIRTNYNGLDLEVTRNAMPQVGDFLRGTNPTTMVSDGICIRHHGEHVYVVPRMRELHAKAIANS